MGNSLKPKRADLPVGPKHSIPAEKIKLSSDKEYAEFLDLRSKTFSTNVSVARSVQQTASLCLKKLDRIEAIVDREERNRSGLKIGAVRIDAKSGKLSLLLAGASALTAPAAIVSFLNGQALIAGLAAAGVVTTVAVRAAVVVEEWRKSRQATLSRPEIRAFRQALEFMLQRIKEMIPELRAGMQGVRVMAGRVRRAIAKGKAFGNDYSKPMWLIDQNRAVQDFDKYMATADSRIRKVAV